MRARLDRATRQQIVALACGGMPPSVIVDQPGIGCAITQVYSTIHLARKAGVPVPYFESVAYRPETKGVQMRVVVPHDGHRLLKQAAAARGMIVAGLLQRLVEAALSDAALIDNVLDDGVATDD